MKMDIVLIQKHGSSVIKEMVYFQIFYRIKKKKNKIIPFLETVSEYNRRGGGSLLFCDNYPYVLEANLLLTKYLNSKRLLMKVQSLKWLVFIIIKI
jgi:hypothetical protein